jgi:hypothetical protein
MTTSTYREPGSERSSDPAETRRAGRIRRAREAEMLRLTVRFARYALSALAAVGFGVALN